MVFSLNQILTVSPNLQIAIYIKDQSSLSYSFFNDVEEHGFLSNCTKPYLKLGERVSLYSHFSFTAAHSLKSETDWPVDFAEL